MTNPPGPDLAALISSWTTTLAAEHKSPNTIRAYTESARLFTVWCAREGRPAVLDRATVAAYTAGLIAAGAQVATANVRHRGLRRYSAWLAAEGETAGDVLAGMAPPKLDGKLVPKLSDDDVRALLKACDGKRLCDRRDEAIVRLALDAMCRADEMLSMTVTDVDLVRGIATIVRGKGGTGRIVPFGVLAARSIDRYLRLRRGHPLASLPAMWLGDRGRGPLTYGGLYTSLRRRSDAAGVKGFHPHRLRHTAAVDWLSAGGSEGGLMAVAGWKSREMIARYTSDNATERAIDEFRRLPLTER